MLTLRDIKYCGQDWEVFSEVDRKFVGLIHGYSQADHIKTLCHKGVDCILFPINYDIPGDQNFVILKMPDQRTDKGLLLKQGEVFFAGEIQTLGEFLTVLRLLNIGMFSKANTQHESIEDRLHPSTLENIQSYIDNNRSATSLEKCSKRELFDYYLKWDGFVGYTKSFMNVVEDIWGVYLEDE